MSKELEFVEEVIAAIVEAPMEGFDTQDKKWAYTRALDRVLLVARKKAGVK